MKQLLAVALLVLAGTSFASDDISMYLEMRLDAVEPGGQRVPTGHHVVFTSAPADLEAALTMWYVHLQALTGCRVREGEGAAVKGIEMLTR